MKLMLIRHAEPDVPRDALTPDGEAEAALLAGWLSAVPVDEWFVSPLVRAQQTAAPTLARLSAQAETLPWLREFNVLIRRPDLQEPVAIPWDWPPELWLSDPRFLDPVRWREVPAFAEAGVGEAYDRVTSAFDALLAERGYRRDGYLYRAERPNAKTLAFFCHFGLATVLLSHLINVSPMALWHGTVMLPSSVTVLASEERRPGAAYFRASRIGEMPHLALASRAPSFAARFCEIYGDGTRED